MHFYERERWSGAVGYLKDGMDEYELIKGYHVRSDDGKLKLINIFYLFCSVFIFMMGAYITGGCHYLAYMF